MRAIVTNSHKKRILSGAHQLTRGPVANSSISHSFIFNIQWSPVERLPCCGIRIAFTGESIEGQDGLPTLRNVLNKMARVIRTLGRLFKIEVSYLSLRERAPPLLGFISKIKKLKAASLEKLPHAQGIVSMLAEVAWQKTLWDLISDHIWTPVRPGSGMWWYLACEYRGARGTTGGSHTMSFSKQNPSAGQGIHMRCDCLRMTSQTSNPVIEIVHHDHQDICWLLWFRLSSFSRPKGKT